MTDAVQTYTLMELIRSVAGRLGDSIEFVATDGTTVTLTDYMNVPQGSHSLTRRQLLVTGGTYAGQSRIITDTDAPTATITFSPALAGAIVAGDTAFCVNAMGGGFGLIEYKRSINNAIRDSYPIARTPIVSSNLTINSAAPTLTVPTTMNEVWGVEWLDGNDNVTWRMLNPSSLRGGTGWHYNQAEGVLTLDYDTANAYHGTTVRIRGEGRHAELSAYTSTTTLNPQWVVAKACYELALMGIDRDIHGSRAKQIMQYEREYQSLIALIRTRHEPTSIAVRYD